MGGNLNFQSNGIVVSLSESIPSSGTETFRLAEHQVTGTESNNFDSAFLWVIIVVSLSFPLLDSWTQESGYDRNSTIY